MICLLTEFLREVNEHDQTLDAEPEVPPFLRKVADAIDDALTETQSTGIGRSAPGRLQTSCARGSDHLRTDAPASRIALRPMLPDAT